MSIHIGAKKGQIAKTVLLPGDPLRAKYIAENFLEDIECYNEVRGMLGFTGTYKGKRISVQGSGMGIPSIDIYINELIREYEVEELIRIGTCGSFQKDIEVRNVILAMSASTNSRFNQRRFDGDYAPTANFELLNKAYTIAVEKGLQVKCGNILSSDTFYEDNPEGWKQWAKFGTLAVEMETTALYTTAAKFGVKALSILTVSDSLVTHKEINAIEREQTLNDMINISLETAIR